MFDGYFENSGANILLGFYAHADRSGVTNIIASPFVAISQIDTLIGARAIAAGDRLAGMQGA
ncbi:MAG: hypothetical protein B7Y47_12760 [Sphingomonas sp. 28-63-12]|nr:MAG: hypothetical protein B7Y47_12760 [Sphingomonas sp. 28-63-12]